MEKITGHLNALFAVSNVRELPCERVAVRTRRCSAMYCTKSAFAMSTECRPSQRLLHGESRPDPR